MGFASKFLILIAYLIISLILFSLFSQKTNLTIAPQFRVILSSSRNISKSLSTILIENRIYPRQMNLSIPKSRQENSSYNDRSSPLFITMADVFYIPAVRNFHFQLQKYNLQNNFIVMCLDLQCVQACQSNNILASSDFVNTSVARIKFDVIVDLSQADFDFVIFDSDVFLSQYHHPLSFMRNWSDTSWDIQFQLDYDNLINIGWFWARPTRRTIDYFILSKQTWKASGTWDQAVMNNVLANIEKSQSSNSAHQILSAKRLDPKRFLNYMKSSWFTIIAEQTNFYNLDEHLRYESIQNASKELVIWHYTCVEKSLKLFLGKYFGQWTNFDGYYTNARTFLTPINLGYGSKRNEILLLQFLITIKLALISKRTLIFPETVHRYPIEKFPAVRAFSLHEIDALNIDYVEPTFLHNRQAKHKRTVSSKSILSFSVKENESPVERLKNLIKELQTSQKSSELILIDFSQFQAFNHSINIQNFDQWWDTHMIIKDNQNRTLNRLRLCQNINQQPAVCLKICT